jgi:phosphatidate cytidylyltransferase
LAHARSDIAVPGPGNGRWSDFGVRLASAAILAPVALLALWHGGLAWVLAMVLVLSGLGAEWAALARAPAARLALPIGLALVAIISAWAGPVFALLALAVLTAGLAARFGWFLAMGAPYAGLAGIALIWLRLHAPAGLGETLFLVAVIWATDIGAYLVGRVAGGAKLAPRISPGKTWSGAVGGLLLAAAAGASLAGMTALILTAALLLSFCAQGGDLLESAIKRKLGVKDSGRTIPGHGGLFDRLDGFLTAAPLAALIVLAMHIK